MDQRSLPVSKNNSQFSAFFWCVGVEGPKKIWRCWGSCIVGGIQQKLIATIT